jgi:hypothetical protein
MIAGVRSSFDPYPRKLDPERRRADHLALQYDRPAAIEHKMQMRAVGQT